MATAAQILELRRRLQDFYTKKTGGTALTSDEYAFTDTELGELIDSAYVEVSDGARTSSTGTAEDGVYALLIARADGLLMIAQDEARRIKWQVNNEVIDPTKVADSLIKVSAELRKRYDNMRNRRLEEQKAGIAYSATGGSLKFNATVKGHYERDFDNKNVRRNQRTQDYRNY